MRAPLAALALALCSTAAPAETRELGAHEHGHVTLQVAVEGETVTIALEAPGENIVGFEHEATTDEQKSAVETARAQLGDAAAVFAMPEAAGCTVRSSEVELHQEGDHNAFEASYSYTCSDVSALGSFDTKLFALYPSIEEIDVEYATPAGQGTQELEASSATVTLPGTS